MSEILSLSLNVEREHVYKCSEKLVFYYFKYLLQKY